jgi:hypothetical protein
MRTGGSTVNSQEFADFQTSTTFPAVRRLACGLLLAGLTAAPAALLADVGDASTIASGLSNPRGIAFAPNGALYVLETASGQAPPFPPPNPGLGAGRLKRQCPAGAPAVLLDGLTFPGGVVVGPGAAAYLTNFGASATAGEVLRLPLAPCP